MKMSLSSDADVPDLIDQLYQARRSGRVELAPSLIPLLRHTEALVREEAVSLLLTKWRLVSLHSDAQHFLRADDDEGVRSRAALGFAATSTAQTRVQDAQTLAEAFNAEETTSTVRAACVEALHLLLGRAIIIEEGEASAQHVRELLHEVGASTE